MDLEKILSNEGLEPFEEAGCIKACRSKRLLIVVRTLYVSEVLADKKVVTVRGTSLSQWRQSSECVCEMS